MFKSNPIRVMAVAVAAAFTFAACSGEPDGSSGAEQESEAQEDNYDQLVARQPASTMGFSPTREGINKWIDAWDEPGKLSYVYMQAANGQLLGYYVLEGLPISYCALLTPTYDLLYGDVGDSNGYIQVPAPSIDGVYYSGGQCNQYYGWDAVTGGYLEWSVGDGVNYLLYDQPQARPDVEPLGYAVIGPDGELTAAGS